MARISGSETFRPNDLVDLADRIDETLPRSDFEDIGWLDGDINTSATAIPLRRNTNIAPIGVLDGALTSSSTLVELDDTSPITVATNDRLKIGDECLHITQVVSQSTFNVTRGVQGTTATAHADGAEVKRLEVQRPLTSSDFIKIDDEIMDISSVTNQYRPTVSRAAKSTTAAAHSDGARAFEEVVVMITEVVLGAGFRGRPSEGAIVGTLVFRLGDATTTFSANLEISSDNKNWVTNESYDQSNLVDSLDIAAGMYHRVNFGSISSGDTVTVSLKV